MVPYSRNDCLISATHGPVFSPDFLIQGDLSNSPSPLQKCEREFREFLKDKLVVAKAEFRELLQETKIVTHESLKRITENDQHMKDILEVGMLC